MLLLHYLVLYVGVIRVEAGRDSGCGRHAIYLLEDGVFLMDLHVTEVVPYFSYTNHMLICS